MIDAFFLGTILVLTVLPLLYIALCFHLKTLYHLTQLLREELRPFPAMTVWLALVPLLGMVWYCVYIYRLDEALRREMALRYGEYDAGEKKLILALIALLAATPLLLGWGLLAAAYCLMVYCHRLDRYFERLDPGYAANERLCAEPPGL